MGRLRSYDGRHTAATRMPSNGAALHIVQRLLRHSDMGITLRHLHLVPLQLQERFSPLDGIGEAERRRIIPKSRAIARKRRSFSS